MSTVVSRFRVDEPIQGRETERKGAAIASVVKLVEFASSELF